MSWYMVIGEHDFGPTFADIVRAEGHHDAIAKVAWRRRREDCEIMGAVQVPTNRVLFMPSCEDSGNAAHVCDLVGDLCDKCGESLDDGEGYDGLCGNCADRKAS